MENTIFTGVVLVILVGITAFYYSLPYLLKLLNNTPEWVVVSAYSGISTYVAVEGHKLIVSPLIAPVVFVSSVCFLLLVTLAKKFESIWLKALSIIVFIALLIIGSILAMPLFWPVSLVMLLLYLAMLLGGWLVLSWVRENGQKA